MPSEDSLKQKYTSLPAKITGIVFWGLVVLGIIATSVMIHVYEKRLSVEYVAKGAFAADKIRKILENEPLALEQNRRGKFRDIRNAIDVSGLVITFRDKTLTVGQTDPSLYSQTVPFEVHLNNPDTDSMETELGEVRILQQPLANAVSDLRKKILVGIALLFFAFGLILQWLLRKILSQPFLQMLTTAREFLNGNTALRFDAERNDEFGFLSRFINRALDHVTQQQEVLEDALERRKLAEEELSREKEQAVVTLESIADAVIRTDHNGKVEYLNPAAEKITGWTENLAISRPVNVMIQLVDENTRQRIEDPISVCLRENKIIQSRQGSVLLCKDDREIDVEYSVAPIRDQTGALTGSVVILQDVGHARELTRKLSFQASHDALTGLYNRREFEHHLEEALESAQKEIKNHALCYIDLDQFKIVNDTCGHFAGDALLRQLAEILHIRVRESDTLARLGGDEFGVLLKNCSLTRSEEIANAIRQTIKDFRFTWEDRVFEIGASIGVVEINDQSTDIPQILSAADMACYAAKDAGRNRVHLYQQEDIELAKRHGEMQWYSRIRDALNENRFELYYQPILPVQDLDSDRIHYEILLRMHDPDGRIIGPGQFLTAAERYNLMPEIDRWVVDNLFNNCHEKMNDLFKVHKDRGDFVIAVNLSGDSVNDDSFLDYIKTSLNRYAIAGQVICFEITETVAISNLGKAKEFITELKKLGCMFALDDFGSGMSSFYYLKNLPIDYLKIDGSYVQNMANDPMDRALVESINQIGHILDFKTIAEFVADKDTCRLLKEIGVDYAQGFFIAEPLPILESPVELDNSGRQKAHVQ